MVTLQETQAAMDELISDGSPNGKLAFWNAALSTHTPLIVNCRQALVMRNYVSQPLPVNRDVLRQELGGLLPRTLNALYEIEKLWNTGIVHFNTGSTFEEQARWRLSMVAAIPGMGMKTVSFALHIFAPRECLLLTIDTWHEKRLCSIYGRVRAGNYLQYEADLYSDIVHMSENEGKGYSPIVYAACLWERTRQAYHPSMSGEYSSHAALSCYC